MSSLLGAFDFFSDVLGNAGRLERVAFSSHFEVAGHPDRSGRKVALFSSNYSRDASSFFKEMLGFQRL